MAGLSSMTSRRCLNISGSFMLGLRGRQRQGQCEGGTHARPGAFRLQGPTEFPGCQRTAVQPEAMSVPASRETMIEYPRQVLLQNPDAGVDDGDMYCLLRASHAHRYPLFAGGPSLIACMSSVADQIDQNLQRLVLVDRHLRHILVVANERDAVAAESRIIHAKAILDQGADLKQLV